MAKNLFREDSMREPFFIVGAMRSGTTLLRLMLVGHPRLAIPPESHFLPALLEFEDSSGQLAINRERVINWLISHQRLADFGLTTLWMRTTLSTLEPFTTSTIGYALFAEYARREGKARWGDKTPRYRSFIPQLSRLFPEAKFIHVLRDGRDTALSAWRAQFGPRTWPAAVHDWRVAIRDVRKGQRSISAESFLEVRYEDLIANPQAVLTQICNFLNEEYDPKMLHFSDAAEREVPAWESAWHSKLQKPLDANNTGKWKTELTPEQLLFFEQVAAKELAAAGYARAKLHPSLLVRAKCIGMQSGYLLKSPLIKLKHSLTPRGAFERPV
ncbi:MAG TPA: sulfotransferase [Candidatus Acidoferrales bacterium]|nr:sulfotransferase [Candidatus Acidoferrales bacterium]